MMQPPKLINLALFHGIQFCGMSKKQIPGLWIDRAALEKHLQTRAPGVPKSLQLPRTGPLSRDEKNDQEDRKDFRYDRRRRKSA